MAQFIIHIGYSKTGTTAVQNFLARNRPVLAEKGILYPDIRYMGSYLGAPDHNLLAWTITKPHAWFRMPPTEYVEQIERQVEHHPSIHRVLLSGESFAGVPAPWDFTSTEDYVVAEKQKIGNLRELLATHQVRILIYLRRQDHWIDSAINHIIKIDGLTGRPLFHSVDEFPKLIHPRLDYHAVVEMWAEAFGRDNIIIAPFERGQFKNADLFEDFLEKIGIDSIDGFVRPPLTVEAENIGLTRDVLEVKRILNLEPKEKYEEQIIIKALQEISREIGGDNPDWDHFLTPYERAELLSRYDDGNRTIAENYLGRRDGQLFFEPMPDPDDAFDPYPGLSGIKVAEIMFRLQRKQNSIQYQRDRLRFALGRWLRQHALWLHALLRPIKRMIVR